MPAKVENMPADMVKMPAALKISLVQKKYAHARQYWSKMPTSYCIMHANRDEMHVVNDENASSLKGGKCTQNEQLIEFARTDKGRFWTKIGCVSKELEMFVY